MGGRKIHNSSQTHPLSGSHPKSPDRDILDGAFVGAGSLKPRVCSYNMPLNGEGERSSFQPPVKRKKTASSPASHID